MFSFTLLPSLCMIVALCFLFETPRWLVYHGKIEKARSVMRNIRSSEYVETELSEIIKDYESSHTKKLGVYSVLHLTYSTCICTQLNTSQKFMKLLFFS